MHERRLMLVMAFILLPAAAIASDPTTIPAGPAPAVDGDVQEKEWEGAASVRFEVEGKATVRVLLKHDGESLFLAYSFEGNDEGALIFPEVLLDPEHDGGAAWSPGDWWFHVSGSDCEARGAFGVYSDCERERAEWDGVPNFEMSESPPPIDRIEMRIPLKKARIEPDRPFGICLTVEHVPDRRGFWPEGARMESPSTWASAVLEKD